MDYKHIAFKRRTHIQTNSTRKEKEVEYHKPSNIIIHASSTIHRLQKENEFVAKKDHVPHLNQTYQATMIQEIKAIFNIF